MRILVIIPLSLSLNGVRSNSSITYGTSSDIVVNSSNAFVSLYINNTLTVGPVKNNLTYIKLLPAGYWKITAASNSSSTNITLYQKISKATPLLLLTVTPGSFVYNGNPDEFIGHISTINNQLLSTLYINNKSILSTYSSLFYFNSSAGIYNAKLITDGNQNYTSDAFKTSVEIQRARPVLYLNVPRNLTYNAKPRITNYVISSVNNQLLANVTLNGVYISSTDSSGQVSEINPGIYVFNISTSGNSNYTSSYLVKAYSIYKLRSKLFNFTIGSFNNSIIKTKANESQGPSGTFLVKIYRILPGVLNINLTQVMSQIIGINNISIITNVNLVNQTLNITKVMIPSCLDKRLNNSIDSFNVTFGNINSNENGSDFTVVYKFDVNKSELNRLSLTSQNISLYGCNENIGWEELPTYLVSQTNGTYYYKAYSNPAYSYSIAEGFSYNVENTPSFTDEYISETGLPKNFIWNASYAGINQTGISNLSMVFVVPPGNYLATFYKLSNSSYSSGQACSTIYYPTNVKAGVSIVIPAGLSFTVNYANYTECTKIKIPTPQITFSLLFVLILVAVFILIIIFLIVMLLYHLKGSKKARSNNYRKKLHK